VVAADKGTATFSDTANALAAEANFWLDDAFASGGSKGYDHKAMGITAKGAWISVQRHFREMGVDVQSDPIQVVGVGDMSGDVFGNGMLLSQSIRLVAAFDHRHIFLDPAPDAAKSWAERARLFALPRSSWDDYDKGLISAGGGVFPRAQKEIQLSPQIRAVLGIEAETIDPDGLMTAILKAPVDLLWFGGIGTYVKAPEESNVGDPANDAIRVNGRDLRVRAIGEGANLGCTQAGRIDFALHGANGAGGRNNTDFIDNSAGVDCSDKEVNIKIALANAKRAGRLDEEGRVKLLVSMTDDVSELVLEDNRLQALGLSIAERGGAGASAGFVRLMEVLEEGGHLDRATEGLAEAESFKRRAEEGLGLTRPELAVLLSSSKLVLQEALEHSTVVDDPALEADLIAAFPPAMREAFREDILTHRLRREILATRIANRLINRLGFTLPFELAEEEGVGLADVSAAFLAAERLFGLAPVWEAIEDGDMPEAARILLFERAGHASAARWRI
jgi:glutamate dehydrogenase